MSLDRPTIEALAEFFVGMLDVVEPDTDQEGDPCNEAEPAFDAASRSFVNEYADGAGCWINGDCEPNGDEKDGTDAEDEVLVRSFDEGPGCPLSDPGGSDADQF